MTTCIPRVDRLSTDPRIWGVTSTQEESMCYGFWLVTYRAKGVKLNASTLNGSKNGEAAQACMLEENFNTWG